MEPVLSRAAGRRRKSEIRHAIRIVKIDTESQSAGTARESGEIHGTSRAHSGPTMEAHLDGGQRASGISVAKASARPQ